MNKFKNALEAVGDLGFVWVGCMDGGGVCYNVLESRAANVSDSVKTCFRFYRHSSEILRVPFQTTSITSHTDFCFFLVHIKVMFSLL